MAKLHFVDQRQRFIDTMNAIGATAQSGEQWLIGAAAWVDQQADSDPLCGRLRKELAPAGRDSQQYLRGVEAFLHTMGRTGNSDVALRDACYSSGLCPPAEESRIKRLFPSPNPKSSSLSGLWSKLNQPSERR